MQKNSLFVLHRYYIYANRMRTHFDELLEKTSKNHDNYTPEVAIEMTMYMSLWYGLLYVVIEGWRIMKLHDSKIDELLKSKNVDKLYEYRNGTFHFHKEYWNRKVKPLLTEKSSPGWARSLNSEFGRYFLENIPKLGQ